MSNHWETHLYTFAVALTQGEKIRPENLAGMRRKAINFGHTEGECQLVEADPMAFIKDGFAAMPVIAKAITMRRTMDEGVQVDAAHRIMIGAGREAAQGGPGL